MKTRVLKQILNITDEAVYNLPGKCIVPLSVQEQRENLVLYFLSDVTEDGMVDGKPVTPVKILIAGTGHTREDIVDAHYLGTVVMSYGLVWHCFFRWVGR